MNKTKVENLLQSEFVKNALLLLGGSLIAQIISMGSAPIITRLFTPENLGVFSLFIAISNIITGVSSLCYERAIVLPKKNEDSINVLLLTYLILFGTCLFVFILFVTFRTQFVSLFGNQDYATWVWLIPAAILLEGLLKNLTFWRIRNNQFKAITYSKIINVSVATVIKIAFGIFIGAFTDGLIGGFMIGTLMAVIMLHFKPAAMNYKDYKSQISKRQIKKVARQYKSFPLFASWNNLMNQTSRYIIVFMFTYFFDAAIVGFYSLCNRFLGNPVSIVSQSVQNAYFHKAAENLSKGVNLARNLKRITLGLSLTGFLPFLILTVWGEPIFTVIFGQNWATAGQYVQIMAPWYFITYIISPANVIYEVCQKQQLRLGFNISLTILRFLALFVGYRLSKDPRFSILLFVIANVVVSIFIIAFSFVIAKKTSNENNNLDLTQMG